MRKSKLIIAVLLVLGLVGVAWASGMITVQVKSVSLRLLPTYTSKVVGQAAYGAVLRNIEAKGDWTRVRTMGGLEGWAHKSALTQRRISLGSGSAKAATGASSEELVLAGKGFNKSAEQAYRSGNSGLNYAAVDTVERSYAPDEASLDSFAAQGGLKGGM